MLESGRTCEQSNHFYGCVVCQHLRTRAALPLFHYQASVNLADGLPTSNAEGARWSRICDVLVRSSDPADQPSTADGDEDPPNE